MGFASGVVFMRMMNPFLPKIPGLAKSYYPPSNNVSRAMAEQAVIN
jgi:hypothetical protein